MATVKYTMDVLSDGYNYHQFYTQILYHNSVNAYKRIFYNTIISYQFGMIRRTQSRKNLSEPEQKLYVLVTRRFMSVFFPAAEFQVTTRYTEVSGHQFKTEGKVLSNPGWLAIYGKEVVSDKD